MKKNAQQRKESFKNNETVFASLLSKRFLLKKVQNEKFILPAQDVCSLSPLQKHVLARDIQTEAHSPSE